MQRDLQSVERVVGSCGPGDGHPPASQLEALGRSASPEAAPLREELDAWSPKSSSASF